MISTIKKLEQIKAELKKAVTGRDEIIDAVVLALAANEHILIEGKHGEAKSYAINKLNEITGLKSFSIQLHRETTIKDIVGLINPIEFQKGKLDLIKTNFWDANVLFCDEFLRARSEFLDFLLEVMVERRTTKTVLGEVKLPIISVIATTNPLTDEYNTERLDLALKDRFFTIIHLNHMIESPQGSDSIAQILKHMNNGEIERVELKAEELMDIPKFASSVKADDNMIINLFIRLQEGGFSFSTRTIKLYKKIVQVDSYLKGKEKAEEEDYAHIAKLMLSNRYDKLTNEKIEGILDDVLMLLAHKDLIDEIAKVELIEDEKLFIEKAIEIIDKTKEEYNEYPAKMQEKIKMLGDKVKHIALTNLDSIDHKLLAKLDTERFKAVYEMFVENWTIQTRYLEKGKLKAVHNIIKGIKHCQVEEKDNESFTKYIIKPDITKPESIAEIKAVKAMLSDNDLLVSR
jgi:MoxR-like ATPase